MNKRIAFAALALTFLSYVAAAQTATATSQQQQPLSVRMAQARYDAASSSLDVANAALKAAPNDAAAKTKVEEATIAQLTAQTELNRAKLGAAPAPGSAPAEVRAETKSTEPKPLLAYLEPSKDKDQKYWLTVAARTNAIASRPKGYSAQARIEPSEEKTFHDLHKNDGVAELHEQAERSFAQANAHFQDIPWQQHLSGLTAKSEKPSVVENGVTSALNKGNSATRTAVGAVSGLWRR